MRPRFRSNLRPGHVRAAQLLVALLVFLLTVFNFVVLPYQHGAVEQKERPPALGERPGYNTQQQQQQQQQPAAVADNIPVVTDNNIPNTPSPTSKQPTETLIELSRDDAFDNFWFYTYRAPVLTAQDKSRLTRIRTALARYVARFKEAQKVGFRDETRFIMMTPDALMCNRLRAMVSTIALGVLTDTFVSISWTPNPVRFEQLFEQRIPLVGQSIPQHISAFGREYHTTPSTLCRDYLNMRGVQSISHLSYLTPLYKRNARLRPEFLRVFGDDASSDGLYHAIFTYFFVPIPSIQSQVIDFAQTHFSSKFTVGIHVRGGSDHRKPLSDQNWARFVICAEPQIPMAQFDDRQFFVATDHREAQIKAQTVFGVNRTLFYVEEFMNAGSVLGAQNALIDVLLMARTHVSVLSPYSSYSELTATLALRPGVFARNDQDAAPFPFDIMWLSEHGSCLHAETTEPSFHKLKEYVEETGANC